MQRIPRLFVLAICLLTMPSNSVLAGSGLGTKIDNFLESTCYDCHANGASEGGLDLDASQFRTGSEQSLATWVRVYDRVASGEMPPSDYDQPSPADRDSFLSRLKAPLVDAHVKMKGTRLRRLNRREYQNTLNDMFGTKLDLIGLLPEDGRSHEFDNVGSALSVSMVHLQRYMDAVNLVMETAIAGKSEPPEVTSKKVSYADTREGEQFIGKVWLKRPDGAVVFFRSGGYPSGMLRDANVRETGHYKIRVTGYAFQSEKPITFAVGGTTFQRGAERPTFGYFSFPPGKPTTVEMEAIIKSRYMIEITPYGINDENYELKNGVEGYQGPGLAVLHVELEGPLVDEFPSRGHKLLFNGINRREIEPRNPRDKTRSWYVPKYEIITETPTQDVQRVLHRVATEAFRRPVDDEDLAPFVSLFEDRINKGEKFEQALRTAVTALFCSPEFLYLQESPGALDDYAIASRLSYFLTRTAPGDELLAAAARGSLTRNSNNELAQHTERLLNDPRFERFITDFTDAWLNLRDIEFTMPDRNLFPEFDQFLQYSMLEETRGFVRELIERNAPIRNLVKSDFAMLNNRLAEHYEIPDVIGPEIRKVRLPADSVRGGLLSQASILKVSANGTNTSPVVRGVWVMERILGEPPQPPPPGVPGVEPDIRGASTLRELLDKHRSLPSCNACHAKIDPPGFALESFNPVGTWRDRYRSLGEGDRIDLKVHGRKVHYKLGPEVDASGEFAKGRSFSGFREFRDHLATDERRLARAFTEKLLTFATGREMGFSDREEIERILDHTKSSNYGLRDIIHAVVQSEIFHTK